MRLPTWSKTGSDVKDTIEFIGLWERLNNPDFNVVEFDQFKNEAGHNYFTLSPKNG